MPLSANLESYWPCDEASGNLLDVHGSNTLTDTNTVGSAAGKVGNCRDFEQSSGEYFTIADNASLSVGDIDFAFNCWVWIETTGDPITIIGKWNMPGEVAEYRLLYTGSRFRFSVSANGETQVNVDANTFGAPAGSTWYMVTCWHDSVNNQIGIAVNAGAADTTSHSTGVLNGGTAFQIGNDGVAGNPFDGKIDEVGYWKNRILTSDERTELYNGGNGRDYAYITGGGATVRANVIGAEIGGGAAFLLGA